MSDGPEGSEQPPETKPGMGLKEAITSTPEQWKMRLTKEAYKGDPEQAASWIAKFTEGAKYIYETLEKQNKIPANKELPRIDFDDLPKEMRMAYLGDYDAIVIPTWLLQAFEGHTEDEHYSQTSTIDGEITFSGYIDEYWFLKGVEEVCHALEPEDPVDKIIPPNADVKTVDYYSQKHEYDALGWQIRAAKDNDFSEECIETLQALLNKVVEHRSGKTENSAIGP